MDGGGLRDDESIKYFSVYPCTFGTDRNIECDPVMRSCNVKKSGQDSVLTTGATSKQSSQF